MGPVVVRSQSPHLPSSCHCSSIRQIDNREAREKQSRMGRNIICIIQLYKLGDRHEVTLLKQVRTRTIEREREKEDSDQKYCMTGEDNGKSSNSQKK